MLSKDHQFDWFLAVTSEGLFAVHRDSFDLTDAKYVTRFDMCVATLYSIMESGSGVRLVLTLKGDKSTNISPEMLVNYVRERLDNAEGEEADELAALYTAAKLAGKTITFKGKEVSA